MVSVRTQRISKELMRAMFEGNVLECHCPTAKELDSTYQSACQARREFKGLMPERSYGVNKMFTDTGGVVRVMRFDDDKAMAAKTEVA